MAGCLQGVEVDDGKKEKKKRRKRLVVGGRQREGGKQGRRQENCLRAARLTCLTCLMGALKSRERTAVNFAVVLRPTLAIPLSSLTPFPPADTLVSKPHVSCVGDRSTGDIAEDPAPVWSWGAGAWRRQKSCHVAAGVTCPAAVRLMESLQAPAPRLWQRGDSPCIQRPVADSACIMCLRRGGGRPRATPPEDGPARRRANGSGFLLTRNGKGSIEISFFSFASRSFLPFVSAPSRPRLLCSSSRRT